MTEDQIVDLVKQILQAPVLMGAAGALISLLATYLPGFREWFAALSSSHKALGMWVAITVLTILVGVSSWTKFVVIVTPDKSGAIVLIFTYFTTLIANQSTYTLTKGSLPESVKIIKNK
jgi:hypothetical protein